MSLSLSPSHCIIYIYINTYIYIDRPNFTVFGSPKILSRPTCVGLERSHMCGSPKIAKIDHVGVSKDRTLNPILPHWIPYYHRFSQTELVGFIFLINMYTMYQSFHEGCNDLSVCRMCSLSSDVPFSPRGLVLRGLRRQEKNMYIVREHIYTIELELYIYIYIYIDYVDSDAKKKRRIYSKRTHIP